MRQWIAIVVVFAAMSASAAAQQKMTDEQKTALVRKQWVAALNQVAPKHSVKVDGFRLEGPADMRAAAYQEALLVLGGDPMMAPFFQPDAILVSQEVRESDRMWVQKLADAGAAEKGKSLNGSSTNPVAAKAAERSGFTDLVALALDTKNVLNSDKSAVSVNLNALAVVGLNSETRSAPAAYRRYGALRRVGGTFTFGAKIPEGEITGLTGLPSAETLFDVVTWDAKVRVVGDRDPRAQRWYPQMLGRLGGLGEMLTIVLEAVPPPEDRFVQKLAGTEDSVLRSEARRIRDELANSLQVSVKVAGLHLTNAQGKDKYSFAVLGDKGIGDTDITFNFLYAAVDDVSLGAANLFTVKTWSGSLAINSLVARNALIQGRATELTLSVRFDIPVDEGSLPMARENKWNVVGGIALPWGDAAKIPVSVTYTNDPNNLTKQKFVSGNIGVSYDFGALKNLFKP